MTEQRKLHACILKGIATLIGLATLAVVLCTYVPSLARVTSSKVFADAALTASFIGLIGLLGLPVFAPRHATQRAVHGLVTASLMALLVVGSHAAPSRSTAPVALMVASCLILLGMWLGSRVDNLQSWTLPLLLGLFTLLGASLLNTLLLRAGWLETLLSLGGVVLFTLLTMYYVYQYTKTRQSCRFDCCEEGVFAIFINFANMASDLLRLSS